MSIIRVPSSSTRRCLITFLSAAMMLSLSRPTFADPAILPDPTLPPSGNPLCPSNLIQCLDIDDFAGHVQINLQVLPASSQRSTAAIFPFGIAMGIFGRVVGSISTQYAFWNAAGSEHQQLGPIRLSVTGRLWPLFPLLSSGGTTEGAEEGDAHYVPPRGFRLGLSLEQEVRTSIFEGANSLNLLTNLTLLRVVGSKALGPFELAGSLGVLFDWPGEFATGEVAAQLSLVLPFFKALKVYVEALGRGVPVYVKQDVVLPALDPTDPIKRQAIIGGGLSYQPFPRVDLGVSVQAGLGGLAPWAITARFLTWSLGHTYEGRAGTPAGQMLVDATREFVTWAAEKVKSIDPYLRNNCILYDDNHAPMGKLGELAPDGKACIYQGLRVPIDQHFWRNRGETRVCYDEKLTDCFLTRTDRFSPWEPIHPMLVNTDCFAYLNGQPWMRTGTPTADKQGCELDGHVIPMGQTLKPNHRHPGYYCYDEPDKIKHQTEKLWCLEAPPQPQSDAQYVGRRFAAGIDRAENSLEKDSQKVHQAIDEGAQGVPLHATTPVKEAEAEGRQAIDTIKNATLDDGERAFFGAIDATKKWLGKPLREQVGDFAEQAGETMASPSTWAAGAGAVLGSGGKALSAGADLLGEAETLGQEAKKVGKVAEHTIPAHVPSPAHRPPHVVTPRGTVLPPGKDYNLVSDDPRKWFQVHGAHDHHPHGKPHTHAPEVHHRPDGTAGSTRRIDRATTAEDIDYADQALKSGEMKLREKRGH